MPLFDVNPNTKQVSEILPASFPALGLWERQDLEAWVTSAPALAGGDFTVVTTEYDRFDRTSERLDILGVTQIEPGIGRLVVVELKRDGKSTTIDLQAIKYAAYVASFKFEDVVKMHADHHGNADDASREFLADFLGGSVDDPPSIDDTPRIVLAAGDFRPEVTTTVLWLIDNFGVDLRCVRLQPFDLDGRIVVHSETLIPLPEAEDYRLGVAHKRKETHEQKATSRAARLLPRLVEAGAISEGQVLHFHRRHAPPEGPPWTADEPLYRATLLSATGNKTLEWTNPDTGEVIEGSPSKLAAILMHHLGHAEDVSTVGVNGMLYWTVDGAKTLRDLAVEVGLEKATSSPVDRELLRAFCAAIPAGTWTSYSALAEAIGSPGANQTVGNIVANDPQLMNAHRVLSWDGRVAANWSGDDGGPEAARKRLTDEGLVFLPSGLASPEQRWVPALPEGAS